MSELLRLGNAVGGGDTAPKLMHGDCLKLLPTLPEQSVDFVCCDPPYGITRAAWDKSLDWSAVWHETGRVIKPAAMVALFASGRFLFELHATNPRWFKYHLIWVKTVATAFLDAKRRPLRKHEFICLFSPAGLNSTYYCAQKTTGHTPYRKLIRGGQCSLYATRAQRIIKESNGTRYPTDVLSYKSVPIGKDRHPTQKPVPLLEHLIKSYCPPGGVVLDFCMGSGSTGIAAANTGRRFIGMELDRGYFDIAAQRINEACTADKETYELKKI